MYFYLSLGSNIDPERSAVQMTLHLCQKFGVIALYPFRYTEPESIESEGLFVNSLAVVQAVMPTSVVKLKLNQIETAMGRDRNDPLRSQKNRAADIDILNFSDTLDLSIFSRAKEGYVQSCYDLVGEVPTLENLGLASYQRPSSVYLDAGSSDIRVVEDELQCFVNGVKAAFNT